MFRKLDLPILLILIGCQPSNHGVSKLKFDSTTIVIFSLDTTTINEERNVELSFLKEESPISLTQDDLALIEIKLEECIIEINNNQKIVFETYGKSYPYEKLTITDFLVALSKYKRQYVAYKKKGGDRYVWVNCFPAKNKEMSKYGRSIIVSGVGGGTCCFSVKINLSKQTYDDLSVNAPM